MAESATYYPAEKVDTMFKSASALMRGLTDTVDALQQENQALETELARVKAASSGKVELQKVAAPSFSPESVDQFVDVLVGRRIIDEPMREKFASGMKASPDQLIKCAIKAIEISESPRLQGHGYTKTASGPSGAAMTEDEASLNKEKSAWNGLYKYLQD